MSTTQALLGLAVVKAQFRNLTKSAVYDCRQRRLLGTVCVWHDCRAPQTVCAAVPCPPHNRAPLARPKRAAGLRRFGSRHAGLDAQHQCFVDHVAQLCTINMECQVRALADPAGLRRSALPRDRPNAALLLNASVLSIESLAKCGVAFPERHAPSSRLRTQRAVG